jgi:hypothetical protein
MQICGGKMILNEIEKVSFGQRTYDASTGLSGIFKLINRRSRTSTPWGPHHFPLMNLWAGAMGVCTASGDQSFDNIARVLLASAFPAMSRDASNALIELSKTSLPDAMYQFGCLNKEKSYDSPEMIEFKRRFSAVQANQPDFIRQVILFTMIVYKFEGQTVAATYLISRLSGSAS